MKRNYTSSKSLILAKIFDRIYSKSISFFFIFFTRLVQFGQSDSGSGQLSICVHDPRIEPCALQLFIWWTQAIYTSVNYRRAEAQPIRYTLCDACPPLILRRTHFEQPDINFFFSFFFRHRFRIRAEVVSRAASFFGAGLEIINSRLWLYFFFCFCFRFKGRKEGRKGEIWTSLDRFKTLGRFKVVSRKVMKICTSLLKSMLIRELRWRRRMGSFEVGEF